jgi:hypothetical protein
LVHLLLQVQLLVLLLLLLLLLLQLRRHKLSHPLVVVRVASGSQLLLLGIGLHELPQHGCQVANLIVEASVELSECLSLLAPYVLP